MKILKNIIITIIFSAQFGFAAAQYYQQKNFILLNHYLPQGSISVGHISDGSINAFKEQKLQLHAPFFTGEKQIFALASEINQKTLLNNYKLEANLMVGWSMEIMPQWKLSACVGGKFQQNEINRQTDNLNQADPLLTYQQFNAAGVSAGFGILQKYFWVLANYQQIFTIPNQYNPYQNQNLNAGVGATFQINDWEIKLPVQTLDLMHFDETNIYAGVYLAYKNNYIYAQSNIKSHMAFELGFKPYKWLSLGFSYELNPINNIPGYGVYSAYTWKSQKLAL